MLKTLTIKNYRCFQNFSLNNLSRINLIVGQNNIGKPSLLEFINTLDTHNSLLLSSEYNYLNKIEKDWELIQLKGKEDKIIEAFKIIKPDIERIGFAVGYNPKPIILEIKGENQPIPLSSMGSGMKRLLRLITTAVILENGVLLIDEIETGLHYEAQTDIAIRNDL